MFSLLPIGYPLYLFRKRKFTGVGKMSITSDAIQFLRSNRKSKFTQIEIAEHLGLETMPVRSALNAAARRGYINRQGHKGNMLYWYRTPRPVDTTVEPEDPAAVIDNLLDAMAASEKALRRAAAILRAVNHTD